MARGRVMVPYQKKAKLWVGAGGGTQAFTGSATVIIGNHAFTSPQTVLRMLWEYTIAPTAAPTAGDRAEIAVAVAKVSTDAFTAGAASMPDPVTEEGFPWLYWASHPFFFRDTTLDSNSRATNLRHTIDIRTQRKFSSDQSLVIIAQYFDGNGNPPLTIVGGGMRILTTLH